MPHEGRLDPAVQENHAKAIQIQANETVRGTLSLRVVRISWI
jgi:phage gp46-like protein